MNKFNFPYLGFGLGLRSAHYEYVLDNKTNIDWFEIITENYVDAHDGYMDYLSEVRKIYPLVLHGVSLSIGGTDALDIDYLRKVKRLKELTRAVWVSDHLCYTGINGINTHDLLPIPYTKQSLDRVVSRIKEVQDILQTTIILENPSTYLEFSESSISEWDFIAEMASKADCGLLLDVNNVFVTCKNHGHSPIEYLDAMPLERVVQIHLAGHSDHGTHAIDTHDRHVIDPVWDLYQYVLSRKGESISTMVEWDDNIPEFPILEAEIAKARRVSDRAILKVAV